MALASQPHGSWLALAALLATMLVTSSLAPPTHEARGSIGMVGGQVRASGARAAMGIGGGSRTRQCGLASMIHLARLAPPTRVGSGGTAATNGGPTTTTNMRAVSTAAVVTAILLGNTQRLLDGIRGFYRVEAEPDRIEARIYTYIYIYIHIYTQVAQQVFHSLEDLLGDLCIYMCIYVYILASTRSGSASTR